MSNRHTVMAAIGRATVITFAELCDALAMEKSRVKQTLGDLRKVGFVISERDDVTGSPAYRLTPAGKIALANGPQPGKKHAVTSVDRDTQPAEVKITGSEASEFKTQPPAEGLAVQSAPAEGNTAGADSHESAMDELSELRRQCDTLWQLANSAHLALNKLFSALEMAEDAQTDSDDAIDFALEQIELMKRDSANLDSILSANRKFCDWVASSFAVDGRFPVNLYECQQLLIDCFDQRQREWADCLAAREVEIHEMEIDLNAASTAADHVVESADMVNKPPHYQGKVECIDAIESALGPVGFHAYCRGNALKYTFRAGRKGDAQIDLAKAAWYLARIAP